MAHVAATVVLGLMTWSALFAIWGFFARFAATESPFWRYVSDASYWVYLIHIIFLGPGQQSPSRRPISPRSATLLTIAVAARSQSLPDLPLFIRHTPIGTFLHGRRPTKRQARGRRLKERLHHFDALRASAMLLLIPYHGGRFIWKEQLNKGGDSEVLAAVIWFVHAWHMPLFFLVSGYLLALALERSGANRQATNRVTRLGIPLVIGMLTIIPLSNLFIAWAAPDNPNAADPAHDRTRLPLQLAPAAPLVSQLPSPREPDRHRHLAPRPPL